MTQDDNIIDELLFEEDESPIYDIPDDLLSSTAGRIDHFDIPEGMMSDDEDWLNQDDIPNEYISQKLLERGFYNLPHELADKLEYHLTQVEEQLGQKINLNELTKVKGVFRSKKDLIEFDKLSIAVENHNAYNSFNGLIEVYDSPFPKIESDMFDFNPDFGSAIFDLTHVAIDTEADYKSDPIIIQCHNLDANRSVLGVLSDHYEYQEYLLSNGSHFIYLQTPNLNDGILLADIETVLSAIFLSAMHSGHKDLYELLNILTDQHDLPAIEYKLIEEILLDKRRTLYLYQNAKYDIKQLKFNHQQCKGKLNVLGDITPEKIAISEIANEDGYFLYLGNTKAGFRYSLTARKTGMKTRCKQRISPLQAESYPLTFLCDTLILSMALHFRPGGYGLKYLSRNPKLPQFEKRDFDNEDKIFKIEDFPNPFENKVTDAVLYGMYDTYGLLSAYDYITQQLFLSKIEEILTKIYGVEINIPRDNIPWSQTIFSTATISKKIIFAILEAITGLSRKEIERNIKQQRIYFKNFELTYLAGKVEAFIHGLIKRTKKQGIFYIDFDSLYPHVAWIIEVFKMYELSSKGELDQYVTNDPIFIMDCIKQSVIEVVSNIKKKIPMEKHSFKRLVGNISYFSNYPLLIATRSKNELNKGKTKRTEAFIHGNITTTPADLFSAIVRDVIYNKSKIDDFFNPRSKKFIKIIEGEMIDLSDFNSAYGDEPASRLYIERKEIKKESLSTEDEMLKSVLDSTQTFLKFFLNTGAYGIGAEGISREDFTGALFISPIGNGVPSVSRSFTNIVEIANHYYGGQNCYCDTDSLFTRTSEKNLKDLLYLFSKTINLKDEIAEADPDEHITQLRINGKKKWGVLTNKNNIIHKVHGKAQYETQAFKHTIKELYKLNFEGNYNNTENARKVARFHSIHQQISLNTTKASPYKGMKNIIEKSKIVYEFKYKGIPLVIHYNFENDSYLVTNVHEIRTGMFGFYFNPTSGAQAHKLQFFIAIPLPIHDEFDDSIFHIEENEITNNFNSFIMWFFEKFYAANSDSVFENIVRSRPSDLTWNEFYHFIIDANHDFIASEGLQQPQEFDQDIIYEEYFYYWKKLCIAYNINPNATLENNGLELFEKINTYNNLQEKFIEITPAKWKYDTEFDLVDQRYFDIFVSNENSPEVHKIYRNIADNIKIKNVNTGKNEKIKTGYQFIDWARRKESLFSGLEIRLRSAMELFYRRPHIIKKLANYFSFDNDKVRRYIDYEKETYKVTRPYIIDIKQNQQTIKNITRNLTRLITTDGMSYFFFMPIENVSLTTMLKADLDRFYTANILNAGLAATKIYYATHFKMDCMTRNNDYPIYDHDPKCEDCRYIDAVYDPYEDMPTPKHGGSMIIPIRFQVKPILQKGYLPQNYADSLNPLILADMIDRSIITETKDGYLVDEDKYFKYEKKQFQHEWMEKTLWNLRFSISIEKYKSTSYNAGLFIDIRPQKGMQTLNRSITAKMHVNPFSFDLANLKLFETKIKDCLANTDTLKPLFTSLFQDIDLHAFKRNASVTESDWRKKPYSQIESYHQLLAKQIILSKLDSLDVKLTQLTVSHQYNTKITDNQFLMTLFINTVGKKYDEYKPTVHNKNGSINFKKSAQALLKRGKNLMAYPHKSSNGYTVSNLRQKWSLSTYWKNTKWLKNKSLRIQNRKKLTDAQLAKVLMTPIPKGLIRFETAFFGFESILLAEPEIVLDEVKELIKSLETLVQLIVSNPAIKAMMDDIYNNVPKFFYDEDADIFNLDRPPPLEASWN